MSDIDQQRGHAVDQAGSMVSDPARRTLSSSQKLVVAVVVLTMAMALIWIGGRSKDEDTTSQKQVAVPANTRPFRPAPITLPPEPPPAEQVAVPPEKKKNEILPEETPIFAYSSGDGAAPKPAVQKSLGDSLLQGSSGPLDSVNGETSLSGRLRATQSEASKASLLKNPDYTITQGTIIPCILQTAIDTSLAGFIKCVIPENIRGATGHVILMDKGTTVVGEIQSGLQQGQARVFVLWTRAQTPSNAVISLSSPGADEVGRAGFSGKIDNHFWKRFGGAMMLSIVQGAFQAGANYAGKSENGTTFNSIQNNGEPLAETALKATIDIPPTLTKNQGETVSIFVARDLDFSDVYQLRIRKLAPQSPVYK
ncbi:MULTISPECIES: type IV secretion system protein VirB10 [unclassified Rhizobium]|uniref:type IV secretion system protein VirB10 n=1 Tax=unclassified Rhizobium TaxID=2613769 RepID=UPI0017814FBD|nr:MULTISPECIES: type IV secretion system protein VirB10 [unclassified Rhizobium]MBD8689853.1 type IV secretion system protein VirB10 [Rhizobium sp. CFBP 13644]MBD8694442.1 type IV secretion system protein VirB10 [Rhizobium sp. CFBP 13717]